LDWTVDKNSSPSERPDSIKWVGEGGQISERMDRFFKEEEGGREDEWSEEGRKGEVDEKRGGGSG